MITQGEQEIRCRTSLWHCHLAVPTSQPASTEKKQKDKFEPTFYECRTGMIVWWWSTYLSFLSLN